MSENTDSNKKDESIVVPEKPRAPKGATCNQSPTGEHVDFHNTGTDEKYCVHCGRPA